MTKFCLNNENELLQLLKVCNCILDDATGDLNNPSKRLWPIRADNYRTLKKFLNCLTSTKNVV